MWWPPQVEPVVVIGSPCYERMEIVSIMKKTILAIATIALLMLGGQAFGEICAVDNVPAATLLLPYFSVDIGTGEPGDATYCPENVGTTFFTLTNASSGPVVAHVTLWTDWTVPKIDFDIFLTGYDVQNFDMRNIFCSGELPVTWDGAFDMGPYSKAGTITGCGTTAGDPPRYASPAINNSFKAALRAQFTGNASGGVCSGTKVADNIAHGYVTIDANTGCSLDFPNQPSYWTTGPVQNTEAGNVLMGDYQFLNLTEGTSEGFAMVHIEAFEAIVVDGLGPSFYGRFIAGAADGREPLPTTWAARYNSGTQGVTKTEFDIWRSSPIAGRDTACGTNPFVTCNQAAGDVCAGLALLPNGTVAFGLDEQVTIGGGGPSGTDLPDICIDWETQRVDVQGSLDTGGFDAPYDHGWYYLNLQNNCTATAGTDANADQAYVNVRQTLAWEGATFSGGWPGIALDGNCTQFALGYPLGSAPTQPITQNPQSGGI